MSKFLRLLSSLVLLVAMVGGLLGNAASPVQASTRPSAAGNQPAKQPADPQATSFGLLTIPGLPDYRTAA